MGDSDEAADVVPPLKHELKLAAKSPSAAKKPNRPDRYSPVEKEPICTCLNDHDHQDEEQILV